MRRSHAIVFSLLLGPVTTAVLFGCGDDDGTEAQRRGVGAACTSDDDCEQEGQHCLDFKGGYCGVENCTSDTDCPSGSACVTHEDGVNYCFLICRDKPECNRYRPAELESNCSSSVTYTDPSQHAKACVPPSG